METIVKIETKSEKEILLTRIIYISVFTFLMSASAFVKIPFYPVPFTLQTLLVLLSANLLGKKDGTYSQILYVTLGLLGLPIFANGGGPGYIFQPSFGYLLGFIPSVYLTGLLVEKIDYTKHKSALIKLIFGNLTGLLILYIFGVIYLHFCLNTLLRNTIPFNQVIFSGFIIFIPEIVIELIAASSITFWFKKYSFKIR
jgi:biotin transport system substrate-specific component